MATATIKSTISSSTITGSRDDGVISTSVSLAHDGTASSYFWEFLSKPPGSAATLSSSSSATPTFTPDVVGSYLIRLTIDGDSSGSDVRVIAVKTDTLGIRIPAAGETNEYNNNPITGVDGWHESLWSAFVAIEADSVNGLKIDGSTTPSSNIGFGGYKITNLGSGTAASDAARFDQIPATLGALNSKIGATLDTSSDTRTPVSHSLGSSFHTAITLAELNTLISDATLDDENQNRPIVVHGLGDAYHSSTTLADLNALVSDATLDDSSNIRPPAPHDIAGVSHIPSTISQLNSMVSDANLADEASIDLGFTYARGANIQLDNGPIVVYGTHGASLLYDGYVRLKEGSDPGFLDSYGTFYTQDVSGITELFYQDNYGIITQITDDGYLDTFNSLRGVGLWAQISDPPLASGKAHLYAKENDGNTELFFQDSTGNVSQITSYGLINPGAIDFDAYAPKSLLDSYAATSVVDGYALQTTLDNYVDKTLLDSYALAGSSDFVDGYLPFEERAEDPVSAEGYGHLYTKQDDDYSTTEMFYQNDLGQVTQMTQDGYLATADGIVLEAPNGSRWLVSVDNSGNLTTTAI